MPPPWSPPHGQPAQSGRPPIPPPAAKPERGRKRRTWLLVGGAVVVVAALVTTGVLVFTKTGGQAETGRTLSQYDFKFTAPQDWVQTDDRVADRQVVIHPQDAPTGYDLVVAQEYVMDYDATADRQKLVDYLKSGVDREPQRYSSFNPNLSYTGRTVISYHERKPDRPDLEVDWYVVEKGRIRVHVGCQYEKPEFRDRVSAACTQAVRTVEVTS